MTALKTLDTDFAAALLTRGARIDHWEKSQDGRKLYWCLSEINPQWMEDYRTGKDGIIRFVANKKMFVNICKTEIKLKEIER